MPARKRTIEEVEPPAPPPAQPVTPFLSRLRNTWEFASLMQYIFLFGDAVKIDKEVDMDALEMECCRPEPTEMLPQIGLALLKHVSSHRGLTPELFDEYTRRQYVAKAPQRNPFGVDETPAQFTDFDVFQKLKVLHQLSCWTLYNPDRLRAFYAEQVPDQTAWRIEEFGWDKQDRSYFVLDDNRLYRLTKPAIVEPPKPKPKAKAKSKAKPMKKRVFGSRSSKRQKMANGEAEESEPEPEPEEELPQAEAEQEDADNGLGGAKWECIAVTLEQYTSFLATIQKSKDPNEKELAARITENCLPELERHAASRERKAAAQRRELLALEKMATAKRSSRIAGKQEKLKEQEEAEEEERKRKEELIMARKEQEKQRKMEEARESRMMTREQRLRDRETKRILHEEELRKLEAQSQADDTIEGRLSERQRKVEMERRRQELEKFAAQQDEWYFDCAICGVHGKNLDDGSHSLACEKCNVWQHSACHGIKEVDAEREDFQFLCASCSRPRQIKITVSSTNNSPQEKPKKKVDTNGPSSEKKATKKKQKPDTANQSQIAPTQLQSAPIPPAPTPPQIVWKTQQSPNGVPGYHVNGHHSAHQTGLYQSQPQNAPFSYSTGYSAPRLPNGSSYQPSHNYAHASPRSQSVQGSFPNQVVHTQSSQSSFPRMQSTFGSSPSASVQSPQNPSSLQYNRMPGVPPQHSFATPYSQARPQYQATPHSSGQAPIIAASPTPSLLATQGNTNMHFSPSTQASASHAYVPTTNLPAPAAISPVKQSSPPPPSSGNHNAHHSNASLGAVTGTAPPLHSSSPNSSGKIRGKSPVKQPSPVSSPVPQYSAPIILPQASPSSSQLTSPPALHPSLGINPVVAPPVKKLPTSPSQVHTNDVSETNDVSQHASVQPSLDAAVPAGRSASPVASPSHLGGQLQLNNGFQREHQAHTPALPEKGLPAGIQ